ncbi:Hypothetical predicted protein [Pelobates cultripes]|uniref:Uncharacterized protein n=1 Tax=Pelobates cultripes TaxID=61616 RepID=A0AAD1W495_PELCU|nr:Hypothetical predicted protein [Pelobates cultripes]
MDGFLHTPSGACGGGESPKMALTSPASPVGSELTVLDRIEEELRTMAAAMATKANLQILTSTIQEAVQVEVAGLRTEVTTQEGRIHTLKHLAEAQSARIAASNSAVAHQGGKLLAMRCHLEDLDNRGRRCNIRVRVVPEVDGEKKVEETLSGLLRVLLLRTVPS